MVLVTRMYIVCLKSNAGITHSMSLSSLRFIESEKKNPQDQNYTIFST